MRMPRLMLARISLLLFYLSICLLTVGWFLFKRSTFLFFWIRGLRASLVLLDFLKVSKFLEFIISFVLMPRFIRLTFVVATIMYKLNNFSGTGKDTSYTSALNILLSFFHIFQPCWVISR
ncbi:hypothetical protein O6H91_Y466800 [Diphasiastrum complanatum]|nr:hypothetical protein O6H91_Y466800 [Diphasiastrum complanatum]